MTILLDTNVLLWFLFDDRRLGRGARSSITGSAALALSDASRWEISVKISEGKFAPIPDLLSMLRELDLRRIGIEDKYLTRLETLPLLHRDPCDRMLVAQALRDDLTVLTPDPMFAKYGVRVADAHE